MNLIVDDLKFRDICTTIRRFARRWLRQNSATTYSRNPL